MPGLLSDTERLRRVFELELKQECANRVVEGGLDRMFIQMQEDGLLEIGGPLRQRVRMLPPGGYRALQPEQRRSWLEGTLRALAVPTSAPAREPVPLRKPAASRGTPARTAKPRPRAVPSRDAGVASDPEPAHHGPNLSLDAPVSRLPGVGKAAEAKFEKLGVRTAGDAVFLFPRRFNDFTDMRRIAELAPSSMPQTVVGNIFSVREMRFGRRVKGAEALVTDGSGTLRVAWFNMPYVVRQLEEGTRVVFSGKVRSFRGRLQMENPEFEPVDDEAANAGRLVPVYPATQGLSQRTLRRAVKTAVDALADSVVDAVPEWLRDRERLPRLAPAVRALHFPNSFGEAEEARRRLALGEFLAIQAAVLTRRAEWQQGEDAPSLALGPRLGPFLDSLPFRLTTTQRECLDDILEDIQGPAPMLRLLQGDVGSGKTVVAFGAMLAAVHSGMQAVLMAPTEILADQHYRSFAKLLGGGEVHALDGVFMPSWLGRPLRVLLLTGSLTPAQKAQIRADVAHGGADIIIGTHALLEDDVAIPRLAMAVVDEQHRFGVMQRVKLRQKGLNPHLLVMTATPIPRTLALTVYGDLEVSTISEMPPGRKPVKTVWVQPHEREEAYDVIRERLDAGEQAFVICPLVEESESLDVRSAEEEFERLRAGPLKRYRLELLHGRMPGRVKDDVMERFGRHEADVLVSTSVIEVGIDVPNATVIVIEGAERFGLSQLHQFRGRVGRSAKQSYCLLFSTEDDPGPDARERLEAMVDTTDGFKLAEVDLAMRGEGEAWGRVQSGANSMLRVAKLTDRDILMQARHLAAEVLAIDPKLQKSEHRALAVAVKPFLEKATEAN
ncbi:MAG: ATP-dependent DNA helicase RecG [Dehalococcoidia bacterium]|nr:ATP-dependent DNA helicase RecG [Dehalococcoidia bacterium]